MAVELGDRPHRITPREFVNALKDWTTLEIMEALKLAESELGIKAVQQMAPQGPVVPATPAEPVEEQEEWTVTLTDVGDKRIEIIKAIRSILGLGLKESKDMTETVPVVIREGISKSAAQTIIDELVRAGGKASLS